MSNEPVQAEETQHKIYMNIKRNWVSETEKQFYDHKVFFLRDGRIGMEYGGTVIVRTLEHWMSL